MQARKLSLKKLTISPLSMRRLGETITDRLWLIRQGLPVEPYSFVRGSGSVQILPDGSSQVIGDNVPPRDYIDGRYYYRHSGMMVNKCVIDGIPKGSIDGIQINNCDVSIVGNVYRVENNTASAQFPKIVGVTGNTNEHVGRVVARGTGYLFQVSGGAIYKPIPSVDVMSVITLDVFTPTSDTRVLEFFIRAGEWVEFNLPQLTESKYQLPDIPASKDGPVTISSQAADAGNNGLTFPLYDETEQPFTGDADGVELESTGTLQAGAVRSVDGLYIFDVTGTIWQTVEIPIDMGCAYQVKLIDVNNINQSISLRDGVSSADKVIDGFPQGDTTNIHTYTNNIICVSREGTDCYVTFKLSIQKIVPKLVPKPWPYRRDDGSIGYGGALERLGGEINGVNIITPGGWLSGSGGIVSVDGDIVSVTCPAGDGFSNAYQSFNVVAGKRYVFTGSCSGAYIRAKVDRTDLSSEQIVSSFGLGFFSLDFIADSTTTLYVQLANALENTTSEYSNIQVREISPASGKLVMKIRPGFDANLIADNTALRFANANNNVIYTWTDADSDTYLITYDGTTYISMGLEFAKGTDYIIEVHWDGVASKYLVVLDGNKSYIPAFDGSFNPEEFLKMFLLNEDLFHIEYAYLDKL